ncbi:MAG: helix-turn-helix domain-containing protein [Clostridia bacterium]|nr:helix-turn-helix domain-containing protein [Clostridia bacterium]
MSVFATRLRELRKEKKLSMRELAKAINSSEAIISYWESDINEPKISHIIKLAKFFDVSADFLLGLKDEA